MTELKFFKAGCADAARIRYPGNDGQMHNVFIDSGFERTFRSVLAEEVRSIALADEEIDLWVVSHIHDDHIGGIIRYIKAIATGESNDIVRMWYYNVPRIPMHVKRASTVSQATSIGQGEALTAYLLNTGKLYPNDITSNLPVLDLWGMKLTVLSPNKNRLIDLWKKYPPGSTNPLERIENDAISETKGKTQSDYHIKLEEFDLDSWQEDTSVENGSSISLLLELDNKKMLWLADAFPSVVCHSLWNLGYSQENPIICDWVKVSHHGSSGNNSSELYEMIDCKNYVITANGENKYGLPTKECIARILRNRNRKSNSHYSIYFTDDNDTLRSIFSNEDEKIEERLNFSAYYLGWNENAWHFY
jgi:beta-lactamase superfamily II metal-dependent hydrolase